MKIENPFLRWPIVSLALFLLGSLGLVFKGVRPEFESRADDALQTDQRNEASYEQVSEIMDQDLVVVLNITVPRIFSAPGIETTRAVSEAMMALDGAIEVKSLTHAVKPVREGFSFQMEPLVPDELATPEDYAAFREDCLSNPLIRNVMIAPDCRNLLILVSFHRDLPTLQSKVAFRREIETALEPSLDQIEDYFIISLPTIEAETLMDLQSDARYAVPIGAALALGVLAFVIRSPLGFLAALLNVGLGAIWLLAALAALGEKFTIFNILLIPILTGVHITLLIHIGSTLRLERANQSPAPVATGARAVFRSSLFASLTTAMGLLALGLSSIDSVSRLGLLGALGVAIVFLVAFGPHLALLTLLERRRPRAENERPPSKLKTPGISSRIAGWSASNPRGVATVFTLLIALFFIAATQLRIGARPTEFLDKSSPTRRALEKMNTLYGGINVAQIELDTGEANGASAPKFLQYVQDVQEFAASRPEVTDVYALPSLLALMNQIWEGGDTEALKMPVNPVKLGLFFTALRANDLPFLESLVDSDYRVAKLVVRTPDMPVAPYLDLMRTITDYANANRPPDVSVSSQSAVESITRMNRELTAAQLKTAGATGAAIVITLLLLWRSWRLTCIALTINFAPIAAVFGCAGLCGIPLNAITVMVAAIVLGVAVDDSVHFLTYWSQRRAQGDSFDQALHATLQVKARPIFYTSLVLCLVFSALLAASFPPARQFGILAVVAVVAAWLATLTLAPAMARTLMRSQ